MGFWVNRKDQRGKVSLGLFEPAELSNDPLAGLRHFVVYFHELKLGELFSELF